MSTKKERIIIIDGNALIHRSFHALPPTLRTEKGVLVNAVYGFTSFLLKSLLEFKPEYIVLTLDKKGPTFRHELYTEYKATRVKAPDELYEQIPIIKEVAKSFNIPIFELSGFEADDLIGTISKLEEIKDSEKIIITGDLDTLQLINKNTKVYTMSRGMNDSVLYDENKVQERYGFGPDKIIDYKALRGDPSDNIPGVKGIGEKTATELIINFENLEGIYKALNNKDEKIKKRTAELLTSGKDKAFLSRELATIDNQVLIDFSKDKARCDFSNLDNLFKLFIELEFRSLLTKAKSLQDLYSSNKNTKNNDQPELENDKERVEAENKEKEENKKEEYKFRSFNPDTKKEIEKLSKEMASKKIFSLKTVVLNTNKEQVFQGLSISLEENESFFIKKDYIQNFKDILEDEKLEKIGHDLKNDYLNLKLVDINLKGLSFDIMLASYLLNSSNRNHELENIAFKELGLYNKTKDAKKSASVQLSLDLDGPNLEEISYQASYDCQLILKIKNVLNKKLEKEKLTSVFKDIEIPLIEILAEMENTGILFDPKPVKKLEIDLIKKLAKIEKEIYKLAKEEFNINSPKQLRDILFNKLELPDKGIKKSKTGLSTADDELGKLMDAHPIIPQIRDYRETNKLLTTYVGPLPDIVNKKTKRIHSHFNQAITATGRLSSTEPNLQNIPARTPEGKIIRQSFVAKEGSLLLALDYSQIELRLAAHLSQDKKMIDAFLHGADIHKATASEINDISLEEVSKKMRQEAKAINFGIIYGQGPHGLSQAAGIPYGQAKTFIEKYFESYPGIKKMMDKSILSAEEKGYSQTFSGRKRYLPEINSSIIMIKKAAERIAINSPIQGGAADIIKLAMIEVYRLIKNDSENIKLLLQVHDELIFEIKEDKLDYYLEKIKKAVTEVVELRVPLEVGVSWANNWGDLK